MEINKKAVGHRISLIRKKKGLTLEEFGKKISNALKSNVSKWERGLSLPNNERLKKIADLGEMPVEELLYGNERYYLSPIIVNIAKYYYDQDISDDKELINHIFDRLDNYSYDDDESSLLENNKDIFDRILLYPWEWDSEGIVGFAATRTFELKNELEDIIYSNIDSYEVEMQEDIVKTAHKIENILSNAKKEIEKINFADEVSTDSLKKTDINSKANKEILNPKND